MVEDLTSKWDRIYDQTVERVPEPSRVLKDYAHFLPAQGNALDIACGLGGNALFLAEKGLDTLGVDISPVAINKLRAFASRLDINIHAKVQDLNAFAWTEKEFNVIVVGRFLDRNLINRITSALKLGGLLFYQTYIREKVSDSGPKNPQYLLSQNELLELFRSLTLLAYREDGRVGDITQGVRNEALLVAQRRDP